MSKIKIGIFGAGRSSTMIHYCNKTNIAPLVAICDLNDIILESKKEKFCYLFLSNICKACCDIALSADITAFLFIFYQKWQKSH